MEVKWSNDSSLFSSLLYSYILHTHIQYSTYILLFLPVMDTCTNQMQKTNCNLPAWRHPCFPSRLCSVASCHEDIMTTICSWDHWGQVGFALWRSRMFWRATYLSSCLSSCKLLYIWRRSVEARSMGLYNRTEMSGKYSQHLSISPAEQTITAAVCAHGTLGCFIIWPVKGWAERRGGRRES